MAGNHQLAIYNNYTGSWVANVSGGTAPYYVYWYWMPCATDSQGATVCGNYTQFAEGLSSSAASLTVPSSTQWLTVTAEVRDSRPAYNTGVGKLPVATDHMFVMGGCASGSVCCVYRPNNYPFQLFRQGQPVADSLYTRHPCGGQKVFRPIIGNP